MSASQVALVVKNLPAGSTLAEFRAAIGPEPSQQAHLATSLPSVCSARGMGGSGGHWEGTRVQLRNPVCELDSITVASPRH